MTSGKLRGVRGAFALVSLASFVALGSVGHAAVPGSTLGYAPGNAPASGTAAGAANVNAGGFAGGNGAISAPGNGTGYAPSAPLQPAHPGALALAALDRRIADLDAEEEANKRELESLGPRIGEVHARVIARGKSFYRLTRAGMLPVGGGFDALVIHAMHVERARRSLRGDLDAEKMLREHAVELSRALERVARDRVALASQRTAMDAARLAMEEETRRQQAFDRAFETSTGAPSGFVPVYGGGGSGSPDLAAPGGFQSSRGRLLFPVAGRAEARPAHREGTDGPGLEITAALHSTVRAVFAGRVAFADRYGPYGRIIIVDHGEHFYSVCGNLASIDVKVGDELAAGERLGTVGDDGQGPMLYFEIRHGTETVPPAPWLGLQ